MKFTNYLTGSRKKSKNRFIQIYLIICGLLAIGTAILLLPPSSLETPMWRQVIGFILVLPAAFIIWAFLLFNPLFCGFILYFLIRIVVWAIKGRLRIRRWDGLSPNYDVVLPILLTPYSLLLDKSKKPTFKHYRTLKDWWKDQGPKLGIKDEYIDGSFVTIKSDFSHIFEKFGDEPFCNHNHNLYWFIQDSLSKIFIEEFPDEYFTHFTKEDAESKNK